MSASPHTLKPGDASRGADRWFREQGLPTFVPLRRWFTDLPRRVAPLIAWVAVAAYLFQDGIELVIEFAIDDEYPEVAAFMLFLALVIFVLAAGLAWAAYFLVRALLRRLPVGIGTAVALLVIAGCLAFTIAWGYSTQPDASVGPVLRTLLVLGLCILVTGMGGGALISWASRLAVRNASAIGHMASIALPVILMLVVFSFFSVEVWQMASAMSWGSIALLTLVVAVLAGIVVLRVAASEIEDDAQAPSDEQRTALLVGTPAEGRRVAPGAPRRLRAPQRINILLALTVAQLVQALFFAGLLAALLIIIGAITVPAGLVGLWLGPGSATQPMTVQPLEFFGATLPLTVNLLKVATILAVIAALPFVFSAVSETRYRERFFDPIMVDMRRAILVRDAIDTTPSR
ncbi:hypothetical protein E3V93_07065 [Microbacterium sp. 3H14]|uniref:hypothetical protein n=1 Tax=unclassified Microbacterium TaxID=2609290 RepID=UPI00106D0DB2|nr:hypothetical protein [Microbacterium sp. 3H14]TFB16397.1 hypothetical protein E3V93_07065 [Microbacterium sp. 3H14]